MILEHLSSHSIVAIDAMAGTGKSTAAAHAILGSGRQIAWLTAHPSDNDPWCLLSYLEASLATTVPALAGTVSRARADGLDSREVGGLLAEAIADHRIVAVLDDLDRVTDPGALSVLGAFVRFLPTDARAILISRRHAVTDLNERLRLTDVAEIGASALAFTTGEASEVIHELAGRAASNEAAAIVQATGGWVAAVLLEVGLQVPYAAAGPGHGSLLHRYIESEIMSELAAPERDLLISTSLLADVTIKSASALCPEEASDWFLSLRRRHLPVTWSPDGMTMTAAPRFRDFLLDALRFDPKDRVVRERFANHLLKEGRREEAVQAFVSSRSLESAARSVLEGIGGVIHDLNFDLADRWIDLLHAVNEPSSSLAVAEFMVTMAREQYAAAAELADGLGLLEQNHSRDATLADSATLIGMVAWAYWQTGRIDDADRLLDAQTPSRLTDIAKALVGLSRPDARHLPEILLAGSSPIEGMLMRVHYYRGCLRQLMTATPASRWGQAMGASVRAGALRATGQTQQALELYEAIQVEEPGMVWLRVIVGAEIMLDLNRPDEAWQFLLDGRKEIAGRGSQPYALLSQVLEAKMHLRLDRNPTVALQTVSLLEEQGQPYQFVRELAGVWRGLALLLDGRADEARTTLRSTVQSMLRGDRYLELPTAATYLSEAEWQCGNPNGADRALNIAARASDRHGSDHMMMQAIEDFPDVISRRLETESAQSRWHEVARYYSRRPGSRIVAPRTARVTLRDLGNADLFVDGERRRPRIVKSLELLAFLNSQSVSGSSREGILNALFDGRADQQARTYLRQALYQLRDTLPDGLAPVSRGRDIFLPSPADIVTDAGQVEALLDQAGRLHGEPQLRTLLAALGLAASGPYFADSSSPWAERRREELDDRVATARLRAASLTFDLGRLAEAEELIEAVLAQDPYRDEGWRLAMSLAHAYGDAHQLNQRFAQYAQVARDLGVPPTNDMLELYARLRSG
ncbi:MULTISPECIES: BTAD domain-containing putative transcriptional regulator [unclassified Nocardioides]|uniref:BTAD domain-containing putative transcriptional regulator n=1 Tax=unclassified Nocardioides TaxID=2615069 RepID=UPI0013FD6923|nr:MULTISPECIES: BTAD domain-containing putative transcriptional regulator [unclassified Nocardioides]